MKRMKLLSLQILVMVVFLLIWHVATTTSLFGTSDRLSASVVRPVLRSSRWT